MRLPEAFLAPYRRRLFRPFLRQIFCQTALAQHTRRALAAAARHARIAGVGVLPYIVQVAQIIGQCPCLRLGEVHQRGVELKGVVHR